MSIPLVRPFWISLLIFETDLRCAGDFVHLHETKSATEVFHIDKPQQNFNPS